MAERESRRPIYREDEWVLIRPGEFQMGSPDSDDEADSDELPPHPVRMPNTFKMGRHEVTVEEYQRFAYATGRPTPFDAGFGEGLSNDKRRRLPVIYVSYEDAEAYAQWLSKETGKRFRLPTEAEWEYAARAGTETRRFWGDDPAHTQACDYANVFDSQNAPVLRRRYGAAITWEPHQCPDPYAYTAPVGEFRPNPWGLYDMLGNVCEWVQDCWHENYTNAPEEGSVAWGEAGGGDCRPCGPGRLLERSAEERLFRQPQQEHARQPEQQWT